MDRLIYSCLFYLLLYLRFNVVYTQTLSVDISSTIDPSTTEFIPSDNSTTSEFTTNTDISSKFSDFTDTTHSGSLITLEPNITNESSEDPAYSSSSESTTIEESIGTESVTVSTTTVLPTSPPPRSLTASRFTWTVDEADSYPSQVVTVEPGYYISVTVSNTRLTDDSYFLIIGGTSYADDATDGKVFANSVSGPVSYLFETSEVYIYFNNAETDGINSFTVVFERVGELTTDSTTTSTTPINWPSTEESDSVYITVHINSKKLDNYNWEVINAFRNCVAIMAIQYCEKEQIPLTEPGITFNNILIDRLEECPYSWPNRNNCVQIRFRLPIFYDTSILGNEGYLLNTSHLEQMWLLFGKTSQCFRDHNFSVYSEPNINKSITWWAIGITLVTILFIILLWFLRVFTSRYEPLRRQRKRKSSDTASIISSKKDSLSSLSPHYLQEHMDTPKLFDA